MPLEPTISPKENFGGNFEFTPLAHYTPADESELLEILRHHRSQNIRAVGRLHSWSSVVQVGEVMIDLRKFNSVVVHADSNHLWAEVGAGCQIKHLLDELRRQGGFTTMTQGLIKEQALAGAASTGTHGSGKHALSHYIHSVRLARFDPATGEPRIDEIEEGEDLAAARCALGCLGIITKVRIPIRQGYFVEEHFRRYDTLAETLSQESTFPLQQFYLIPWNWKYYAQHRREAEPRRSVLAPLYRLYWSVGMDVFFHFAVMAMARRLPASCTTIFYRWIMPRFMPLGWKVVDRSDRQLSMGHELFRHIETEVFVSASKLAEAIEFVTCLLRHAAGEEVSLSDSMHRQLADSGMLPLWDAAADSYVQHYPICIRKILPDDCLISMASGREPMYSISIVSYVTPKKRAGFFQVTETMTKALAHLFGGRPHWGKHHSFGRAEFQAVYPLFNDFRDIVRQSDPKGQFANEWLRNILHSDAD